MMRMFNGSQTPPSRVPQAASPQGLGSDPGNRPEQGEPTSRPDITHRPTLNVLESAILRELIEEKWKNITTPSSANVSGLYNHYLRNDLIRKGRYYLLEGILTQTLQVNNIPADDDRVVMFREGNEKESKIWNKAVAAWLIKNHLVVRVNARFPERPVLWGVSLDWVESQILRITKHVEFLYGKRCLMEEQRQEQREASRLVQAHKTLYLRRKAAVENRPTLKHLKDALILLGEDGMSSDEEMAGRPKNFRHIHRHPWRSDEATKMIRYVDKVVERDDRRKPRKGNSSNVREQDPVIGRELMLLRRFKAAHNPTDPCGLHVKDGLPLNFYNMEVLEHHPQFNTAHISPREFLRIKEVNHGLLRVPEIVVGDEDV
ncbi:hypothetical protein E1B28_005107 [Marasmius oreades]|uniref:Uncharacterized protein n=1 Tax=Marasmius oreades TaxID=181124 RepID=A0A9P7V025_9AGAR|nr:uncharacterized protein E1B28_005107 [Marasmius oreades]KAG7097788.1 hypothetical protein E1B28_005107 [Marasmius oreades]